MWQVVAGTDRKRLKKAVAHGWLLSLPVLTVTAFFSFPLVVSSTFQLFNCQPCPSDRSMSFLWSQR